MKIDYMRLAYGRLEVQTYVSLDVMNNKHQVKHFQ